MYTRDLAPPKQAFFLFGPRGTGKSTWIRQNFSGAYIIDLLPHRISFEYAKDPSILENEVLALPKEQWIVIDEVQKNPALLDEVHNLMENHGYKNFALTGSSARKVKRGLANMLAGRAILRYLFPLTSQEINYEIPSEQLIQFGMLPLSINASNQEAREEYLNSYVTTYISEEIKFESLVRNVASFARFLEIAALMAGQTINVTGLARESGISRDTVRSYFSIFEDTLLGSWLPAYRPRAKVREVAHPKFYWFDAGVLNAVAGSFEQPMPSEWKGVLLEHWIHHELRSYMHYQKVKGKLSYWKTHHGTEIDFLWNYGEKFVAIEVKHAKRFRKEYLKGIDSFSANKGLSSSWLVYLGEQELRVKQTRILPVIEFLKKLHYGEIIG